MTTPRIILGILILTLWSCSDNKTSETYLIPDGYQGKIIVVYDQDKGKDEEFEAHRRLYRIDSNGILLTKFKFKSGSLDEEYYYQKKNGERKIIKLDSTIFWVDSTKKIAYANTFSDTILVRYFGGAGTSGTDTPNTKFSYTISIVGTSLFVDTTDLEKFEKRQWQVVFDKLK